MKIHPVETELFHSAGQMDRRKEAESRFSQFCVTLKIMKKILLGDIKTFKQIYARRVSLFIVSRLFLKPINFTLQIKLAKLHGNRMYIVGSKSFRPKQLFKVREIKQVCYFST